MPPVHDGSRRILVGVIALVLGATASVGAGQAAASGLHPLHAADGAIRDSHGRQVLLRGVNVTSLTDQYLVRPSLRATEPLRPTDYRQMRALGFNVIRLAISWSKVEPRRGQISDTYLARIAKVVNAAARHGIYTFIDMHSGGWGKYVSTPPGVNCPAGWVPAQGWNGAPQWATYTSGETTCRSPHVHKRTPAVRAAWRNFWHNHLLIQSELTRAWSRIAGRFAREPGVLGFDLLNEPDPAGAVNQRNLLGRFYANTISAIRQAETRAGGFHHIVLFEPNIAWRLGTLRANSPSPGFSADHDLVFAPHIYAGAVRHPLRRISKTRELLHRQSTQAVRLAHTYGTPLLIGEWGFAADTHGGLTKIRLHLRAQDRLRVGNTWWQWRSGCGWPSIFASRDGPAINDVSGNLNPVHCPNGRKLPSPEGWKANLSRPYPQASPGKLTRLRSGPHHLSLSGKSACSNDAMAASRECQLVVWLHKPLRGRPSVRGHHLRDLRVHRVYGGWVATATVVGHYSLTARS